MSDMTILALPQVRAPTLLALSFRNSDLICGREAVQSMRTFSPATNQLPFSVIKDANPEDTNSNCNLDSKTLA